jgi:hypothetical protein
MFSPSGTRLGSFKQGLRFDCLKLEDEKNVVGRGDLTKGGQLGHSSGRGQPYLCSGLLRNQGHNCTSL